MRVLFLSHQGVFDAIANALASYADTECCLWKKGEDGCPMTHPDIVILDNLSLCLTYEEERLMGIASRPMRCIYMFGALKSKGGPMVLDWRMFMFNERFLTPALCDQDDYDEEIDSRGLPDEKIKFDYLPLFTSDFVSNCPERFGFDYGSNPFVVGQTIQMMTNKNSLVLKRACGSLGAKMDLVYGINDRSVLMQRRESFHMSFDQMRRGNIGRSAFETMSHGIPTMAWVKPSTMNGLDELASGCPIINVYHLASLTDTMGKYMENRKALSDVGRAQAEWMRSYYNARSIACFWRTKLHKLLEERVTSS